jgi:hypothetical protein
VTGSRFLPSTPSRFLQKMAIHAGHAVARPASRFIARHKKLQRVVRKIPILTKFLAFFAPEELTLAPPEVAPEVTPEYAPPQPATHITPVYNRRARKPKGFTLG